MSKSTEFRSQSAHDKTAKISEDGSTPERQFIHLCNDLVSLLASEGLRVRGFSNGTPYFEALPAERKREVLQSLSFYLELCQEQVGEGMSMKDNQTFTWRALKRCKLVPGSNLIDQITADSVIQFYSRDNVQIFRNLQFFELCSYTLEDLYCREWWNLFTRETQLNEAIQQCAREVFEGKHPAGIKAPAPAHVLEEIASAEKFRVEVSMEFVGPLYAERSVAGLVCIHAAKRIN